MDKVLKVVDSSSPCSSSSSAAIGMDMLPDCVILEILSRLPTTKDAIRISCLSKQWKSIWTLLPNIIFINNNDTPEDQQSRRHFFSCVDETMTQLMSRSQRQPHLNLKLNKFQLHSIYECKYESQVNKWIRYAINCNVQHLDLSLWAPYFLAVDIVFDDLRLFNNSIFTHLKLACSFVNPTATFTWINLKSLYISLADLKEDLIQDILSGSSVHETFTLDNCSCLEQLDITSKSVKEFVISGSGTKFRHGLAKLKAPNILSLKLQGSVILSDLMLLDLTSLVEAHLDYAEDDDGIDYEVDEENVLELCILSLCHVKELKLGVTCSNILSRLEANGFIDPSNTIRVVDDGPEGDEVDS